MGKIAVVEDGIVFIKRVNGTGGYLYRMNKTGVVFADLNESIEKVLLTYRDGRVEVASMSGGNFGWLTVNDATLARWLSDSEIFVQHSHGRNTVHSANGLGIRRYL